MNVWIVPGNQVAKKSQANNRSFTSIISELKHFCYERGVRRIALAVSGGADSMCMAHFLCTHRENLDLETVFSVTIDHGIRGNSEQEARDVQRACAEFPGLEAHIIKIDKEIGSSRIQEKARQARYDQLKIFCEEKGCQALLTAHHLDDQAETFLFRLSSGSGLDGLAGIEKFRELNEKIILCRPFLDIPKRKLIEYCKTRNVFYVTDPSNDTDKYSRGRLRSSWDVLEREGLTSSRLGVTSSRLARAREALEEISRQHYGDTKIDDLPARKVFDFEALSALPQEIRLRILKRAFRKLVPENHYGPRMEQLEQLERRLFEGKDLKTRSLGHCLIKCNHKAGELVIEREQK